MLIALYMPNGQVKTYNSHEIPMAFMLTRSEREHTARILEDMCSWKSNNVAIQFTDDPLTRHEFADHIAREAARKKMREAIQQNQPRFKAYIEERFGELGPQEQGIHVIGGG